MKFEIINYDVVKNAEGDYEVDQAYANGLTIELEGSPDRHQIISALIEVGYLVKGIPSRYVDIAQGAKDTLYLIGMPQNIPLGELRLVAEPKSLAWRKNAKN